MRRNFIALFWIPLVIGACSLPFTSPPQSRRYVHLEMAPLAPTPAESGIGSSVGPRHKGVLLIADIGNSGRGGGQQIVYKRDAGVVQSYQYTYWTRPLQDQFREFLIRRIDQAKLYEGVSTTGSGIIGDYQLNVHIYDFYFSIKDGEQQIVGRVNAELIDLFTRRLLRTVQFEQVVPLDDERDIADVVRAFGDTVERIVSLDIVPWLRNAPSASEGRVLDTKEETGPQSEEIVGPIDTALP